MIRPQGLQKFLQYMELESDWMVEKTGVDLIVQRLYFTVHAL